ncbi:bacteriohemerythrin [Motiliproteus sediminis]|uniref:bacteriohemerythrin n=1 Tax=Motiliproteus sediminis TaxID=1468178 RepID=UPI001AEFE045|nr:hemerythrin family protein [Motiliproteus sediminis]
MPILWRDSMAIGHPTIDSEHKYLFCLINAVELALQIDNAPEVVRFYLEQLIDYTRAHFEHEEKIQLQIQFAKYAEHKMEHQKILNELELLRSRLNDLPKIKPDPSPVTAERAVPDDEIEDYDPSQSYEAPAEPATDEPHTDAATAKTLAQVVSFLRHWILDHVLQSDIHMKSPLQSLRKR